MTKHRVGAIAALKIVLLFFAGTMLAALQGCALSVEQPTPEPTTVELDLFGEWRSTERGLEPLDSDSIAWARGCRVDVELYAAERRGEGDRWGVAVFDSSGAVAHADDGGTTGPISIALDGGSGDDCTVAIVAPTVPNGDALISVSIWPAE